jgi:hypothetical protein
VVILIRKTRELNDWFYFCLVGEKKKGVGGFISKDIEKEERERKLKEEKYTKFLF